MNVLAIGATGFIGQHVVTRLVGRGHDVAVVHRGRTPGNLPGRVLRFQADRSGLADLRREFRAFAPDVVIDLIALTESDARRAVEVFGDLTDHLVVVSSADVYRNYDGFRGRATAPPDPAPLSESSPLRDQLYPYRGLGAEYEAYHDYDKILVERAVSGHAHLRATVLRLPAVHGPGDRQHRLRRYLRPMIDRRPAILLSPGEAGFRWTKEYVENVAAAIASAATHPPAEDRCCNVGPLTTPTEAEWIRLIGRVVGWEGRIVEADPADLTANSTPAMDWRYPLAIDTFRLHRELAYEPTFSQEEGVRRTVAWELTTPDFDSEPRDYSEEDAVLERMT